MAAFTHHIFICINQRERGHRRGSCDSEGDEELRDAFKKEVKRRGLAAQVRANSAGCLDQCELGPTIVIYPQAIWYGGVKVADVPRIIDETIVAGRVIDELLIPDDKLNCHK
jgi:(2Fe-2S) ferredoxin